MLKIPRLPQIVQKHARNFKEIFSNKAQYQHFKQYVTGLMICENKTCSGIQSAFIEHKSVNSLDHFMINTQWPEVEMNQKRVKDLHRRPETASRAEGIVAIDDTLSHKTGKHIEDAEYHFDHSIGKMVLGHNLVSTQYKASQVNYPVDYRLYHRKPDKKSILTAYAKLDQQIDLFKKKQYLLEKLKILFDHERRIKRFKTKIQLAIELVKETESLGIKAKTYVFDSWFLCKELVKIIESYSKDWISILKSNRRVLFNNVAMPVSEFIRRIPKSSYRKIQSQKGRPYWVFTKSIRVLSLGKVRLVISYDNPQFKGDPAVLVTNRRDWEPVKIINTYELRWSIDAFYRDAKQHLGLEAYQLRNAKGIKRHWYFVFLAYSFLMLNVRRSRLNKRLTAKLATIGESSRALADEVTMSLILWIYKNFQKNKHVEEVIECLIA
jgi:SRSO17 transposase